MDYIEITKWIEFQHYKNRNPIWIKLYNSLLDNELFELLKDDSKLLYILLLMLNSRKGNGNIPASPEYLRKHLPFDGKIDLQSLIDAGFIILRYQDDSKLIAKRYNRVEESRVEKKRVEHTPSFDAFWKAYPKKVGKQAAEKAYQKIKNAPIDTILNAIEAQKKSDQWKKQNGQFIPNPATWLNQGRWEDEVVDKEEIKKQQRDRELKEISERYGNDTHTNS
jgi:hypothetical protein